ncbi:type VI secretion system Vgr family protein [Chondromyces apiculatus]|uniref:VgrG protein n=1 Tax=Chondromyces apiculatus DSM 436 TaxID=1192034 RepID=A0A017T2T3_9BACT|nr:type VI secretion system tip protein VgrG [Chondromyces apiculatus]EYF02876.1 VgrG protein [Chondromyces apiculatus DSM 436]
MPYAQDNTILAIATPLGANEVYLISLRGEERVSGLFRFDLDLASPERALDFAALVGQGVTVTIRLSAGGARVLHGVVTRLRQAGRVHAGGGEPQTIYRAEVHPWLWFLTRTTDSRIFQEKSVPDIVKQVFDDLGFADYKDGCTGSYQPREYCVQYQETAFDFVSRLLEEEGIYYYFTHEDGKHTLVLADDSGGSLPCPDLAEVRYVSAAESSTRDEDVMTECELTQEVVAGAWAATDYNFQTPETSLLSEAAGEDPKLALFEYPGGYPDKGAGDAIAPKRIEAEEAVQKRLVGASFCRAFIPGHTFKLTLHDRDDANAEYLLLGVVHTADNDDYQNTFEALPKEKAYRPPRLTPKPSIPGAQTAVVVGKGGEEMWVDEHGRIKVQFHWDRYGQKDENSSCWIRVAQGWAGQGWGIWFLPRIGQEVVVAFLGGDPDRPLVTGAVYNATQTLPYGLPGEQTKSTILSRSSKEGSAGNELRFEDKKDSEELYMHAQKDMSVEVENDWTIAVKHDQSITIDNDQTLAVGNDRTVTVAQNQTTTVEEGDYSLTVSKGNRTVDVSKGNEAHSVKGTRDVSVEGAETHANKANFTHDVKGNYVLKVKGNLVIEAKSVTIKSEKAMTLKSGDALKGEAAKDITLKGGGKVTIKGSEVKAN